MSYRTAIITIDEALKNEESGRKAADKVLTDNLAKEIADREASLIPLVRLKHLDDNV